MIIVNKNGTLIHNKKRYKCALGKNGVTKKKKKVIKKHLLEFFLWEMSFTVEIKLEILKPI